MKYIFIITMLFISAVIGCKHKEEKPQPPVVVVPPVIPPVVPPAQLWPSGWDSSQDFCKSEGKKFDCGNPVWFGLLGCAPDNNGDNHAEGPFYLSSLEAIKAMSEKQNVAVKVKMKNGSEVQYGAGFAAPCSEM